MSDIKTLTSDLIGRLSLATRAGLRFDGKRDLYQVFGYKRSLVFRDYLEKFHRQDIARRIVSAPVSATWRTPPKVKSSTSDSLEQDFSTLVSRNQIWKKIERADKLAGIGNYSVLMLGMGNTGPVKSPVVKKDGGSLLFVQPYSQPNAEIIELDNDPTSPRFGKPLMYRIRTRDPLSTTTPNLPGTSVGTGSEFLVHHSRIVHIAEDTLESDIFGTPRLEAVFNILDDLLKVAGGTSEAFWLTGNRGMQADIDKDTELSAADAAALSDELDEYQHQLRRWIKTKGVSIKNLGSDVPSPKDTFNMLIALISGATGIPRRILTGSEAGQLASEQDRANWADRINERRFNFAEPCILTPLITKLATAGILPDTSPEDIKYAWPSNFQLTPLENAQTMAQKARATINMAKHFSEKNPFISVIEARRILELPDEVEGDIPTSNLSSTTKK